MTLGPERIAASPKDFHWGVATSAHQVEGSMRNNQWALWERLGRIRSGDRADRAIDWWRDVETDFDIAQQLGVNALRLSVEWSRIEPREGQWDGVAIRRYQDILASLRRRGIRPFVTLHHFTNPIWFEEKGGFLAEDSIRQFERFTEKVVDTMGELCSDWATFNEPNVYVALGYQIGMFPPGHRGRIILGAQVTRTMCRAHAAAYRVIHRLQPHASVGWAQHYVVLAPENPKSNVDRLLVKLHDRLFNQNFTETLATGRAPFPLNLLGKKVEGVQGTFDYVGVNYYSRLHTGFDITSPATLCARITVPDDLPQGDRGVDHPYGEAYVEGLTQAVEIHAKLGKPVIILEHGVPDRTDRIRPWLLESAAKQIYEMVERGIDLRGYFHWTLTDNFEWNEGWHLRFGLVEYDPVTRERKLRKSAHIYKEIIRHWREHWRLRDMDSHELETLEDEIASDSIKAGKNIVTNSG